MSQVQFIPCPLGRRHYACIRESFICKGDARINVIIGFLGKVQRMSLRQKLCAVKGLWGCGGIFVKAVSCSGLLWLLA